ncbi:hypothetical protein EMCRGX_G008851 [Ephydatia muelleri]
MEQSAGSRSESDDISVSGAGKPSAAKEMKQCGPTSAELKPDVKGLSRLITTLNAALGSNIPPPSWNLGVKTWGELPTEVYQCYLDLKTGFKTRFDPTAVLLTVAALVHPGHKSLNWLTPRERENAIKQFKEELLNIAGVDTEPLEANMEVMEHSSVLTTQILLDSYFDSEATIVRERDRNDLVRFAVIVTGSIAADRGNTDCGCQLKTAPPQGRGDEVESLKLEVIALKSYMLPDPSLLYANPVPPSPLP